MPVLVRCPICNRELIAPEELVGKLAACPQCDTAFPVTQTPLESQRISDVPPPVQRCDARRPPAAAFPAAKPLNLRPAPQEAPPAQDAPPGPPVHAAPGDPAMGRPSTASPLTDPKQRAAKPARFIAADSAETRVRLGEDGQLPALVLEEAKAKESPDEPSPSSNPLLLIGALCLSFAVTVLLLLVDTESKRTEPASKTEARWQIEQYYTSPSPLLKPYQALLRQALQAHNREDYATENRLYRRVLDMLHAENKNEYTGLTGMADARSPPNDKHLEELLSTLLSGH